MTKTNTRRSIVSILLVLMMLLTMVPITGVTASAAEDDTSYVKAEIRNYDTFATYLRSYDSRDLKLEEDINYTIGIKDLSIDVIRNQKLDLNGHKIRIDASRRSGFENLLCIRRGEFTLYDSKGGGELAVSFPNDNKAYSIIMMSSEKEDEPSKFTMNGGTLTKLRPNITDSYGASGCIGDDYFNKPENGKRSQITINGGTINCPYEWDRSKSLLDLPVKAMPLALQLLYSNLTINGGTFNGIVWTDLLWRGEQDTEPRVVLNGGVFNSPFVVEDMQKEATQMVIDGARFNDGFHVDIDGKYGNIYVETIPPLLLKSGVFTSPDKNPKLDIYNVTANSYGNGVNSDATARAKQKMILHSMKCFPNSAIKVNGKIYTSENIGSLVGKNNDAFYLKLNSSNPIEVIRNAWGMKSVTLDGNPIDYFKDWKGTVERMDNSTAHTIKFEWYPLASELVNAGYSYNARCDHYISGSSAVQQTDTIAAGATSHTVTIPAGADPKVYSFDLHLNLQKNGSSVGIFSNEHIVKLVVSEAPPAPPAPVAHSITVTNGRGTANPTSAMAGETVTVKAKDDTANNMMFTRWNTDTPGVTFADATKQETTFVMPDCDVKVNPGFQQVSFRKQPLDSWPQVNHGGKATVTFSAPITKWELKEGNTTVTSSGSLFINTGNPITVDIPAQNSEVEKTYTIVVTANGQKFSSNEFKVKWVSWPQAPAVEFTPADGTQFVGEIEVIASDALYAGEEIFEIAYTTDGTDPKTSTTTRYANTDTEHITLTETTTIKARTYNHDAAADAEKWGPLATATFTKYSDSTLPMPTITPEGTTYTGSITAYLTAPALDGVKLEYCLMRTGDPNTIGSWAPYDPETGITVNEFGTITLCARSTKSYDAETPDGLYYVATITSETATATYTRTYSAAIDNVTVGGKVGKTMTQDVVIRMNGDRFKNVAAGDDVSAWFNLPAGLTATVKELSEADGYHRTLTVTISGKPTATSAAAITVTIPKDKLYANNTADLTVLSNPNAYYSIALDADHQHDYTGQPYLYLDPGNHYQECKAGDGYNIQPHAFTPWTDNGNGTHSRHCTVCKMTDGSTYTETAEHTYGTDWKYDDTNHWHECQCGDKVDIAAHSASKWIIDTAATKTAKGAKHKECTVCKKVLETAKIPATGSTHTHTYKQTVTPATTSKDGKIVKKCSACKNVASKKTIYKASKISISNKTYTYDGKAKKPTVTVKDSKGKKLSKGKDYTVSYSSGRKNVGRYAVKIKLKGNYSGTVTKTFDIVPKGTSVKKISASKKGFKVYWKAQKKNTTGYEIQYSTAKSFKNAKTVKVSKNSATSQSVAKLSGKKKYFVRVRTYKTVKYNGKKCKVHSSWSKPKTVVTKK